MPIDIVTYVELQDVFPGKECTLKYLAECLQDLPLDLVLVMCAKANLIASGPAEASLLDRQQKLAGFILSPEALENLKAATRRVDVESPQKVVLFFRSQLLELTRWALLFCEGRDLGRAWNQDERDLFAQAALICSSLAEATMKSVLAGAAVDNLVDHALVFFRAALGAALQGVDVWRAIGRGHKLFLKYLPKHYPEFEKEFEQATGLLLIEYLTTASILTALHTQAEQNPILSDAVTLGKGSEYERQFAAYQALQICTADELRSEIWPAGNAPTDVNSIEPLNIKPLRQKPIIALQDGRGAVLDPILLADSVSVGPLFQVLGRRDHREVFGHFGDAFEEYAGDVFSALFPTGSGLHQCLHRDVAYTDADGINAQIDYCLDYVDQLVLIEAKSIFLPDEYAIELNEAKYKSALAERYLHGKSPVGVGQLARAIRALSDCSWRGPSPEADLQLVYPVLLVHDRLLQGPLATRHLAGLLASELGATRVAGSWQWEFNAVRFAPLTILTIEDLENLQNSPGIDMRDLLHSYSESVPERNGSLHDYIASTDRFRSELRINQALAQAAAEFLEDCSRRVFGQAPYVEEAATGA